MYVIGGKTGYLDEAKYCLMTRIQDGERNLIGVILSAQTRNDSFQELQTLFKYVIRK